MNHGDRIEQNEAGMWDIFFRGKQIGRDSSEKYARATLEDTQRRQLISGRTLQEWREFARRDDCLDQMVPSDLRALIGKIQEPQ